ncbi:hypothetical protein KOW79_010939 [Hemibagrus wyckioides]|uniref:Uncharacterized protein n=1 Tax=Hemibagrus wyckioides TaxID=337641 RepID=A0A9D3SNP8_9TELE|nr:hypothetical protein KOW79_010939 [Hemibagrus wyckioides]
MNKKVMDSEIAKKNQSLTTAEEMRTQTKLVMQPYANWEEYLTPAPLSIAILGELVFISSKTDFSINKNPPKGGYKFIRYPDSFRACLMQVCNSGWWAFNEAHKNMDQIRLHTMAVPDYMKTAVKILFHDNDEVVEGHLPDQLENIRVIADDCLELASSTEKRFTDVINIIQELLEACVNAEHFYGEELDAIKNKLKEAKLKKQTSEEATKRSEKAMKAMEEELKEAHETYKSTMDSLPSGWGMIGMDLLGAVAETFTAVSNGMTSLVNKCSSYLSNNANTLNDNKEESSASAAVAAAVAAGIDAADAIDQIIIYKPPITCEKSVANREKEQSCAQLDKTREIYEKSVENMEKNQKELTEILITMRNCEVKERDFNTTIQMLVKGMDAMGRVKEQWEKMVHFFQMVSHTVKISLNRTLKDFVSTSEKTQKLSYNAKLFSKDLLYNQACQASNIASLVNMISTTYTERAILALVLKNKEEFEEKNDARMEKIDRELLAILPAASPEEMKSIQAAVQSGYTEEEEDENTFTEEAEQESGLTEEDYF